MRFKAFLALLLVSCIALPALAQTTLPQKPDDTQDDVVRITTNLVQVDAVVTKDGKPVTNLTVDDFEIYEDGRKQAITSFAFISNVPNTTAPKPEVKKTDAIPFAEINRDDPHRTIAFVVDDLGLSHESISRVRRQLRKFIAEQAQPNDLIAIIRTGGEMGALQQFTNDKRILGRAVEMLRWNHCSRVGISVFTPAGRGPFSQSIPACGFRSYGSTLNSLRFIVDSMGQLPGRKSLVLLSDSIPRESQDEYGRDPRALREGISDDDASPLNDNFMNYGGYLQKIAEKAIRSSVVIYSVDTQGLVSVEPTAADVFQGNYRQAMEHMQNIRNERNRLLFDRREGGELLARQTGGFQIRNSNSFELNRIVEDQSGYYLLGYRPTQETFNRSFHHIKAKVKRGGMTLRTRFGFFGVTEDEAKRARPAPKDLTNLALASPFRAQDIEVDLTSFFAEEPQVGAMVRSFIYVDVNDLEFNMVDGKHQGSIEVHGVVFGDNGVIVEQLKQGATLNLSDSELDHARKNGLGMGINMPVKRNGSFQVRVVVRDRRSEKIGSAGQFVLVPNLKDKKLAVSGIVLGTLDQTSSPNPAEQSIINPGSRRFAPNGDLYFAYRLYNAVEPGASQLRNMVMQARIFRDGKAIYTGPEVPVGAGNQKDLNRVFVDGVIKLSPDLEPGNYYLQVMITDKAAKKDATAVQWADFEIAR